MSFVLYYIQWKGFQTEIVTIFVLLFPHFLTLPSLLYEDLFLNKQLTLVSSGIYTDPTTAGPAEDTYGTGVLQTFFEASSMAQKGAPLKQQPDKCQLHSFFKVNKTYMKCQRNGNMTWAFWQSTSRRPIFTCLPVWSSVWGSVSPCRTVLAWETGVRSWGWERPQQFLFPRAFCFFSLKMEKLENESPTYFWISFLSKSSDL